MALSNWDTLALDKEGKSTNGVLISKIGAAVSIYKNWLYVSDKIAWQEESGYAKHTIMEIREANMRYKDVYIYATRGPQQGVYCLVYTVPWKKPFDMMVGIGCYGFKGDTDKWIGVSGESIEYLEHLCKNQWPEMVESLELKNIIKNLKFSAALRFNQGDEFFAQALGTPIPATKIGKAEEPELVQILNLGQKRR